MTSVGARFRFARRGVPAPAARCRCVAALAGLEFEGNSYSASGEPLQILYGGESFQSLGAWSAATGQEQAGAEQAAQ